jgi:hypothetical protein
MFLEGCHHRIFLSEVRSEFACGAPGRTTAKNMRE